MGAISLRQVAKTYGQGPKANPVIQGVDAEIADGEFVVIVGPSGCGKSTLLGVLGGVHPPQQGSVNVLGQALYGLGSSARDRFRANHIGFLFQQFNLIPYLSVLDNVLLPCRFSRARREKLKEGLTQEAQRLLAHLDLSPELWQRSATQLSVGQQQRVAAARALIGRPEIIIADEPTSSLDADSQNAFLDLLGRECAAAGSTLIFVSHDKRLATAFGREIALPAINRVTLAEGLAA